MFDDTRAFVTRAFLRSTLELDYRAYSNAEDAALLARLRAWSSRMQLKETSAEGAFTQTFFVETWGYGEAGRIDKTEVTLIPKIRIPGEGAGGGVGEADVALGWFGDNPKAVPQVLCEYKDIRSSLDAKQNRKGSTRSPVEQCLNYVRGARRGLFGNEPIQPWWGLVTDMNEFRLYWFDRPTQFLRFVISNSDPLAEHDLLSDSEIARFDRFLFATLFNREHLISKGGRPQLLRMIEQQWVREKRIEEAFYGHYRAIREKLFATLTANNSDGAKSQTEILRLCQKILDRFIFAFFCEDMGSQLLFPPQLLRDHFKSRSCEPTYDPDGDEIWTFCKRLFRNMNAGGALGAVVVPKLNGGLFESDPDIEEARLPNHMFATAGQGASEEALDQNPATLLYLCARYNYSGQGDVRESLTLYSLGRIFEQSITELDYRVGELEDRASMASVSKRERDGVFYTPEAIVEPVVAMALDPWFAAAKEACCWDDTLPSQSTQVVEAYKNRVARLRVLDPACGSGAFLISAFRRILQERVQIERDLGMARGDKEHCSVDRLTNDILTQNIFGIDINPAAVEIAKLSLWLHSAQRGVPLASLRDNIVCGNSLVGPDFYGKGDAGWPVGDRVRPFDWATAFPDDQGAGRFDIVVGNPPYVSIQAIRKVDPAVADYLQADRGGETYESARTGNFDLYLPFIEQGLRLLRPGGRMGYIAPSLWVINKYGEGLRKLVHEGRHLERWVDFKSYQIFEEATTYTALQIYTHDANSAVRIAISPNGELAGIDWDDHALVVPYEALAPDSEWLIATGAERALIDRLASSCANLGNRKVTNGILVGLQTSADTIYHLRRIGRDRYVCSPKGASQYEVEIEDAIMRPLISGPEAKRYEQPETEVFLLFPYAVSQAGAALIPVTVLARDFPKAWAHLRRWEIPLRQRENGKHDDEAWYRFGRNQNLDKQEQTKLIVAQTAPELRVSADAGGDFYLNNVRVNAIVAADNVDPYFLLGVLNGSVANFVFKRISKPKRGGYYEANKQFIAPLPVPQPTADERNNVAILAKTLEAGWTRRRRLLREAEDRLSVMERSTQPMQWLWPDLLPLSALDRKAPANLLNESERRRWAMAANAEAVARKLEHLQAGLAEGSLVEVSFVDGELKLLVAGTPLLARIYLEDNSGALIARYWRYVLLKKAPRDPGKLANELCRIPTDPTLPAARQFVERVDALGEQVAALAISENAMDALLAELYGLSPDEMRLVAAG